MKKSQAVLQLKAGERVEVINRRFSSVPMVYEFNAEPIGGDVLSGEVDIEVRKNLFSKPSQTIALQRHNVIKASMWDTFVKVSVTAGYDLKLTLPDRRLGSSRILMWVVLLVMAVAVAAMLGMPG